MQPIELPTQFQITTKTSSDTICCAGFYFNNFRSGRPVRTKNSKITSGVLMTGIFQANINLLVVVSREGPYIISLNLYNLLTHKLAKRGNIHVQTNSINSRNILRPHFESRKIIFYLESQATIEIRNSFSLKPISTFSLAQLCKELNMSNKFSELRSSVDLDYIPHLSSIVMLLDSKIVLVQCKKTKAAPMILFDGENEEFSSLHYNSKQRTLLVEGTSSLLLITFDEVGVNPTRLLTSNKLGKASKLLCWNPFEELVVVSQRIAQKREHYHILSYRTENLSVAASVLDVPAYGTYYDEDSQSFLYIEGTEEQQAISRVSLKDFNKNIESFEKPAILEGECMAYIPVTDHQHDCYDMMHFHGFLYVGPHFSNEKVFIR